LTSGRETLRIRQQQGKRLDDLNRPVAVLFQVGAVHRAYMCRAVFDRRNKQMKVGRVEVFDR
jgi:hypothetical protein